MSALSSTRKQGGISQNFKWIEEIRKRKIYNLKVLEIPSRCKVNL